VPGASIRQKGRHFRHLGERRRSMRSSVVPWQDCCCQTPVRVLDPETAWRKQAQRSRCSSFLRTDIVSGIGDWRARGKGDGSCTTPTLWGVRAQHVRRTTPQFAPAGTEYREWRVYSQRKPRASPFIRINMALWPWQWDAASDARIGAADPRSAARFEGSEASADDRRRRGPSRYACSPTLRHLVPAELAVRVSAGSSAAPQGFALQISRIRWLLPPANVGFAQNRRTATARQQTLS